LGEVDAERLQARRGNRARNKASGLCKNGLREGALKGLLPGLRLRKPRIRLSPNTHRLCKGRCRQHFKPRQDKTENNATCEALAAPCRVNLQRLLELFIPCGKSRPESLCDGHGMSSTPHLQRAQCSPYARTAFAKLKKLDLRC